MKAFRWILVLIGALGFVGCKSGGGAGSTVALATPTPVDAACGQCKLGLAGEGCDLAVRIHGRAYYVDGVDMDKLGDAHAEDGMCNAVRQASVTGKVVEGRFVASTFELMPATGR